MDAEVTIEFSGTEAEPKYALRVTVPVSADEIAHTQDAPLAPSHGMWHLGRGPLPADGSTGRTPARVAGAGPFAP